MLFLSIFRPVGAFDGLTLPVGPLAVIAAFILFVFKVFTPSHFHPFWQQFRTPLLLITAYTILCLVSLFFNYSRYEGIGEFLRWGLVFVIGQSFLPLCIFLFLLSNHAAQPTNILSTTIPVITGLLIMLIPASVLIQLYLPELSPFLVKYFVGGDLLERQWSDAIVRGVLATSTDLGAISGILWFIAAAFAAQAHHKSRLKQNLLIICSILFAFVGALSESRNFILFVTIASITIVLSKLWSRNNLLLIAALPVFPIALYFSAYVMPDRLVAKLGRNIQHFENISIGAETSMTALLPRFTLDSLGQRGEVWECAIRLIRENPFLGVSNGGFRLADGCASAKDNTHNILLQSAIDAGVLGAIIISALLAYLIKKSASDAWSLAFVLGVIATLMVDNFTDHSYAWIVVVSYSSVLLIRLQTNRKTESNPNA